VVGLNKAWRANVWELRCRNSRCTSFVPYSGDEDRVFNFSNKYMITYEAALDYWHTMANAAFTFRAFHASLGMRYRLSGCEGMLPSQNTLR
jgi:hypothetical protein